MFDDNSANRKTTIHALCLSIMLIFVSSCKEMSTLTANNLKKSNLGNETSVTTFNINFPSIIEVNKCIPIVVSLKNSTGDQVTLDNDLNIQIQGDLSLLFSDSGCSSAQPSVVMLAKNTLSKVIYAKPVASQSYVYNLLDMTNVVKAQSFILTVTNPIINIETLKLSLSGPAVLTAGQCRSYVVSLQNSAGASKNSDSTIAIALSGAGAGGHFYNGTNCSGAPISLLDIVSGSSFSSFSYSDLVDGNVNIVADSPLGSEIQSAFYSVVVNPSSISQPSQIILSGPSSVTAGACSGPVVIRTVDASFNSVAVTSNTNFTVTGGAGFSVFSDASCSTSLVTPSISSLNSSSSLYFIASNAGNIVIAADDSGPLTDGSLSVQVTASSGTSAVKFTLAGPSSVNALACSAAFVVKTTNGSGIESPVNATTTVNIAGKGSGDFYADAACSSMISSLTFAAGDSSKPFYYKGSSVANLTFNVDDPGPLTPASTNVAIVADFPAKFIIGGPDPIVLGDCRAYTVTTKDVNNFVSVVSSTTSVNLTGAGAGAFYSDSSCVNSTTSTVINSGQSGALYYYKTLSSGNVTFSADNSGVLTTGTMGLIINPLPYSKVVFSRPSVVAGNCVAVTLTLKDSLNTISIATSAVGVTLTPSGSSAFYSASNCTGGVLTNTNIAIGQSSTTVYLKDAVAETITLALSSIGLTSDSWVTTVLPDTGNTLKLNGPATNSVGSCNVYDLRLEDSLGNLAPAASAISINFSGLSNAKFYSDINCTNLVSSVTLGALASQTQIYLKGNIAEDITIGASSGVLAPASKTVSLIAGSSDKLVMNGVSTALAGACTALSVEVQDNLNNPITQSSSVSVNLSGNGSGSFYSDSGCTAVTSSLVVAISNSSSPVWFKSNTPASLNFISQAVGLFDGAKNLVINPLAPSKLVLTGLSNITAGVCTAYSVSLQDTLNNLSSAGSAKNLNFTGAGTGAFYSDGSCSLPTASITLTSSQVSAQIYYKASDAQAVNLTVDDSGLPDLAFSVFPVTVASSGGATSIALKISGSTSINTNTCVPYAVMTTDTSGLSYNVSSNTTVTLGGAGTGLFYSDSGCTSSQSTVDINTGSSLAYIYYKSTTAQNLVFSATAVSASTTTIPVAVVSVTGAVASRLTITGNSSILTNSCIPYVISVADSSGNSINTTADTTVAFSGEGDGVFYSDAVCSVAIGGTTTVTSGTSYSTVYYKNSSVQNLILIAQSSGLSNGALAVSIASANNGAISGPAVKLSFIAQPSAISSVAENFGVQPIVAVQDTNNNIASTASDTITLAAFTDNACTLSAGSILVATANPINANGGVASFSGVNVTSAQVIYLRASSAGLVSACSQGVQVYPSIASKLTFSTQPSISSMAGANLVIQPEVSILNYTNQVVTSATNTVSLAAYSDASCTQAVPGVFNVNANNLIPSSGVVNFSGINYSLPATIYLKATAAGLTAACSSGITVSPAAPYRITIFSQPATSGKVGNALSLTARLYDSFGSLSPASHSLAVSAFKSNNCTGSSAAITGTSANAILGTATFSSIMFSETGIMSLKVTDTTDPSVLSVCTNAVLIDGGNPAKLVFSVQPPSTGRAYTNFATAPIVQVQDSSSNVITSSSNQVTIGAYSDTNCLTPAAGVLSSSNLTLSPSYGQATFSNLSYSLNQTIYLKASSAGLTSTCSDAILISAMPMKMAAYDGTTCVVMNGGVYCWGDNAYNKVGDGNVASAPDRIAYPSQVVGVGGVGYLTNITDVAVGLGHVCANSSTGAVYCWGRNDYGQIGDNTVVNRGTPVQVLGVGAVGTLSNVVSVTTSYLHSCALNTAGNVFCWGYNGHGQMGDNTLTTRNTPVKVLGVGAVGFLSNITAISAKDYHDCALNNAGAVFCWGYNGYGQLGDGTGTNRATPIQVKGVGGVGTLSNVTSLSSGGVGSYGFNCAVVNTGGVYCWGYGGNYNIGDLGATNRLTPVQVVGVGGVGTLANIASVSAGGYHACAVSTAGSSYCWGYNAQTQLGNNSTIASGSPIQTPGVNGVGNLSGLIGIVAASYNTCAFSQDGAMYCWGQNTYGQLGDQTYSATRVYPVKVRDINTGNFTSVSVGYNNACGIAREKVYCWGYGANGELGDGTLVGKPTPTLVSNLSGVKQVSMGQNHGCAVLKTGEVYCWGYNNWGQLGDNSSIIRPEPTQVLGVGGIGYLTDIVSVSASNYGTCAVNSSGSAFCWGYNSYGEVGDNTTTMRRTPVQVLSESGVGYLSNIISISSGYWHNCALKNSGAVYCWGYNGYGQLGENTATNRSLPYLVSGMSSGVTEISSGHSNTCAIKNGAGYCWGHVSYANTNTSYYRIGTAAIPQLIWPSGVTSISGGTETVSAVVNGRMRAFSPVAYYAYHIANAGDSMSDILMISESTKVHGHPMYCGLKNTGVIYCWGHNNYFNLFNSGYQSTVQYPSAIIQPQYNDVINSSITTGENHTCANVDGVAQCWGASASGALGNGLSNTVVPKPVLLASNSVKLGGQASISAGSSHSCSLTYSGEVYCWGDNTFGKLGNNSIVSTNKAVKVVGAGGVGTLAGVTYLSSGYRHSCSVAIGSVYCWGNNSNGQLGINSTLSMGAPVQTKGVNASGYLSGVSKVVSGKAHSCALKDGNVYCWGSNSNGQLGANIGSGQVNVPVQVVSVSGMGVLENVKELTAGANHTCAVADGIVYCWGSNISQQLGNDSFQDSSYPVGVMNSGYVTLTSVSSITGGANHACATNAIGEVYCWGAGASGQIGNNLNIDMGLATNVVGLGAIGNLNSSQVASGSSSNHTCALSGDQSNIYCWGQGSSGQLGNGTSPMVQIVPTSVTIPLSTNLMVK